MNRYFAQCDGEEEHIVQLTRQEAVRDLGTQVLSELDERLPPSTKPRVPAAHCPSCWESMDPSAGWSNRLVFQMKKLDPLATTLSAIAILIWTAVFRVTGELWTILMIIPTIFLIVAVVVPPAELSEILKPNGRN